VRAEMLRPVLVVWFLVMTPLVVYSASLWPDEPKINVKDREQREQFFDRLAEQQAVRRENVRRKFEGPERSHLARHW
jgi:hypothetical protein